MPQWALSWFSRVGQQPQEQPPRIDYYLHLGDYDSLGIKLREGRIEIKQREAWQGTVQLGRQFVGVMEQWRKWSWALVEPDAELAPGWTSAASWIGVEKKRWLLRYQAGREEEIVPAPDGEAVEQGCQVELAQVRAQGQVGWSLSFESYGGEAAGRGTLLLVAAHLFSGESIDLPLSAETSYGYPKWLAMLEDRVQQPG